MLNALRSHPFLRDKIVLKGGTALNLFTFKVPRLSVDIDLNYIGAETRDAMLKQRPQLEKAIRDVVEREGCIVQSAPWGYAGGKWPLRYKSAMGGSGSISLDINYMYRVPLLPIEVSDSHAVGPWVARQFPVLNIHELAAGKLAALLSRGSARDWFDSDLIFRTGQLNRKYTRVMFVAYIAMTDFSWQSVSADDIMLGSGQVNSHLMPMLRTQEVRTPKDTKRYAQELMKSCQEHLESLLAFSQAEKHFLSLIKSQGQIDGSLLTEDATLRERIERHPNLRWKAMGSRGS